MLASAGPRGNTAVGNAGIVLAQLKPRRRAQEDGRPDRRGAAAAVREGAGHPRIPAGPAADPPRRQPHEEPVPVHAAGLGHGRALQVRPDPRAEDPRAARGAGRHERHAALEPAAERDDRPRPRLRRSGSRRRRSRTRSTPRTARARSRRSTRRPTSTRSSWSSLRSSRRARPRSACSTCARPAGELVPLSSLGSITQGTGPLTVAHQGQLPAVSISFNLRPGVALGNAVAAVERVARQTLPATVQTQLPGHGPGVPELGAGARAPAARRDPRDLHRARDPLRELHPPAHDPDGAAVRRVRRARDAHDLPHGAFDLRVRRHHPAGGPGQEERHHDGRLRDRGAARARA